SSACAPGAGGADAGGRVPARHAIAADQADDSAVATFARPGEFVPPVPLRDGGPGRPAGAALAPARQKTRRRRHAGRELSERGVHWVETRGAAARATAGRADRPVGSRGLRRPAGAGPPDRAPARAPGPRCGGAGRAGRVVRAGEGLEGFRVLGSGCREDMLVRCPTAPGSATPEPSCSPST